MRPEILQSYASVVFGCDPELFFSNTNGDVIGAEKVIGKEEKFYKERGVILDGVQVELNPQPSTCRQSLSSNLRNCFLNLQEALKKTPELSASFTSVVDLKKEELDSLGERAKVFGCAPSLNVNGRGNEITVDAATYLKRAAGGHIHLGLDHLPLVKQHREELIPLLDILVGNTCVMVDLDANQKTRRLHYGRAGEYRLPKHGVEYRTLSNFWLKHYLLVSMVMGLSRLAVSILNHDVGTLRPNEDTIRAQGYQNLSHWCRSNIYGFSGDPEDWFKPGNLRKELLENIDLKLIEKAINENDLELAKKNYYGGVRPFIKKYVDGNKITNCAISNRTVEEFDYFLEKIWEGGLNHWFPQDPLTHWTTDVTVGGRGFESFLGDKVHIEMRTPRIVVKAKEVLPGAEPTPPSIEAVSTVKTELNKPKRKPRARKKVVKRDLAA